MTKSVFFVKFIICGDYTEANYIGLYGENGGCTQDVDMQLPGS